MINSFLSKLYGRNRHRKSWNSLVVLGVLGISQVEDDGRVRASTTAVAGEDALEIDGPVEAEAAVVEDIDPVRLVVARSVEDGDLEREISLASERLEKGAIGGTHTEPPWTK